MLCGLSISFALYVFVISENNHDLICFRRKVNLIEINVGIQCIPLHQLLVRISTIHIYKYELHVKEI